MNRPLVLRRKVQREPSQNLQRNKFHGTKAKVNCLQSNILTLFPFTKTIKYYFFNILIEYFFSLRKIEAETCLYL